MHDTTLMAKIIYKLLLLLFFSFSLILIWTILLYVCPLGFFYEYVTIC